MAQPPQIEGRASAASSELDPDWYRAQYPDVDLLKMDPVTHYERYGMALNRATRPGLSQHAIACDVALITTCRFPGGNASSSIDEINFLRSHGLNVRLIHCPINGGLGKEDAPRWSSYHDIRLDWNDVASLTARVVICRHPVMASSAAFRALAERITARATFVVINNSVMRPNGAPVYDIRTILDAVGRIDTRSVQVCPIGPLIRAELIEARDGYGLDFALPSIDWTPTFDLALYQSNPKPLMEAPFQIGRHGRDGAEKWHEDRRVLQQVYPDSEDFEIRILGGARNAQKVLKKLPANWSVHEFGAIEPHEYLSGLDAFVYFPRSGLIEAFGRTIVEAMLGGVPVLLPPHFAATFGDMAIYCEPGQVANIVKALARDDATRIAYLSEVQALAIDLFSSRVIAARLEATGLLPATSAEGPVGRLSEGALAYKRSLESVRPNPGPYGTASRRRSPYAAQAS